MYQTFTIPFYGKEITIETGKLAKQANGSVLVRCGETAVLVAVTGSSQPRDGVDFFPLTVDFEEKMYAVGKIPGGFIKREGRPSEAAILVSRLIDRPIRPMFPDGYRNDVQIVATAMSVDQNYSPDMLAMLGASAALSISDIPFNGPIAGVRVGLIKGQFLINPNIQEQEDSELNLVVAGTADAILMVEAGAKEISEETMLDAILFGHEAIKQLVAFQNDIVAKAGKEKRALVVYAPPAEILAEITEYASEKIQAVLLIHEKLEREAALDALKADVNTVFNEKYPDNKKDISYVFQSLLKKTVRKTITVDKIRPDGRGLEEVRPVSCEVGILPRAHGSGLFTRGQTQVLTVTTLGAVGDGQILDGIGVEDSKRYMHHYNFPPYSVGEARPLRSPGRREIGHGALAERALIPVIPSESEFPYAIRLVSEVLESNGSSSMGSVCGSTLSLMQAGVPIKAPVSGVAMGLVKDGDHFTILTDIQGMEDALGDMDFKVAGTTAGITAIQMDIKIDGIDKAIFEQALAQAKRGRAFILDKMMEAIDKPNQELSKYAPRIITLQIHPDKIRDVIGPGGKVIKGIIEQTGVKIDIEDDGKVFIAAVDVTAAEKAIAIIEGLTAEVEVGKIYLGRVTRLMQFGAFVEILPGKEGLVHISKLALERVEKVEDVVSVGDEILVKVTEIDKQGRVNLSRKDVLQEKAKAAQAPAPEASE